MTDAATSTATKKGREQTEDTILPLLPLDTVDAVDDDEDDEATLDAVDDEDDEATLDAVDDEDAVGKPLMEITSPLEHAAYTTPEEA